MTSPFWKWEKDGMTINPNPKSRYYARVPQLRQSPAFTRKPKGAFTTRVSSTQGSETGTSTPESRVHAEAQRGVYDPSVIYPRFRNRAVNVP